MEKRELNIGWKYRTVGEETYREVVLPHDAMLRESRGNENASGTHGAWFRGRDYEYIYTLMADEELLQRKAVLEFEGVYRLAEVYVNGVKAYFRPYGFTNFYVPLNAYLQRGENEIRVKANNADQPNCRWYAGAGIYRPVHLYLLPQKSLAINGVRISTTNYAVREMEAEFIADGAEKGTVDYQILDGERILCEGSAETGEKVRFRVEQAELWSLDHPKLYMLKARFGEDEREETFGIRQVEVSREKGFALNGKRVILLGACIHSDNGLLGAAAHPYADARKIELLKRAGYNAVRSAHNPCSKATLQACDRLGMLVLDEYTDGWYIHKTRYDYAQYLEEWWKQDMREMVEKDFNHPSVVMYSTGNEVSETAEAKGIVLTGEMTEYLHGLDATRPVTCGINIFFNYLSSLGFGVYSEAKAAKGEHIGSAFFNNIAGVFGDKTMKLGATLHGCDVKTRDAYTKTDVAGYNYGILRYKKDLKKYPDRIILGSETFCNDAYKFYELAKRESGIIGDFVWAGMDYLGEVGIGSWEYARYAKEFKPRAGWISAGSGRLDLTGRELGEALYTRVAFEKESIRMAAVPAEDYKKPHSPSAWKMTNARESWCWEGCEGKRTRVEVYTRAYAAELTLNGKRIGYKRIKKDCKVIFKAKYASGKLVARALDEAGKEIGRTELESAQGAARLILEPERRKIAEKELAYVRIRYADAKGQTLPGKRGKVKVRTENGELLALGHACPYNAEGYLREETDTYYGEALAILRPKGKGKIKLTASGSYGIASAEVEVL